MIAKIIVDNKSKQVDKPFDYLVPKELEGKIKIGSRVLVPFSSGNREIEGFCVGTADTSDSKRLKSIIRTANDSIGFDEDMLELIEWMHKKYLASYLDIIHTIVPSGTALKTKEWRYADVLRKYLPITAAVWNLKDLKKCAELIYKIKSVQ